MKTGSAPCPDGFPTEFYRTFWDVLGEHVCAVLPTFLTELRLPESFRQGRIILLPKEGGDPSDPGASRPITLLNTSYKLLASVLAQRLHDIPPDIVTTRQTCSVVGRSVHTLSSLTRDVLHYTNSRCARGLIASLDQAKAFDRVEHPFLFATLDAFGFPPEDFPHLLKCLRNTLLKYPLNTPDGMVSMRPVREAFKKDSSNVTLKAMPGLTSVHLQPNGFEKMRVSFAFQLFGDRVINGLQFFQDELESSCSSFDATLSFFRTINNLIKIMTSRFTAKALRPGSKEVEFLKEFLDFLSSWESHAKGVGGFLSDSTADGLRVTDCPLSPLLFVLSLEPFLANIDRCSLVRGLPLSGSGEVKATAYADDITLYLRDADDLGAALQVFATYGSLFGARLNEQKSRALWVNAHQTQLPRSRRLPW
ncbi:uncharacterized protein ISCGN_004643 [Ixodes scapularis]